MNKVTLKRSIISFLIIPLFLTLGMASCSDPAPKKNLKDLPNIVLLISDDADNSHYGFQKHPRIQTPNIDFFAQNGVTFTNARSPSARCRATLGAIATGLLPHQTGIYANRGVKTEPTDGSELPNQLKGAGYTTYIAGKFWEPFRDKWGFENELEDMKTLVRINQNKTLNAIKNHGHNNPFFLWWAPLVPHTPHNPPEKYVQKIDRSTVSVPPHIKSSDVEAYIEAEQNFEAMTLWLDESIGDLVKALKENGQYENTLFIFLADNGYSSTYPSKGSPYEKGLQATLIFYWPNKIKPAMISSPVDLVDVYATILDLVNIPIPKNKYSQSLKQAIKSGAKDDEPVFGALYPMFTGQGEEADAASDLYSFYELDHEWKYIFYVKAMAPETEPPIYVKYEFMDYPLRAAGSQELFNLNSDPDELVNLAGKPENTDRVAKMHQQLLTWWQQHDGKSVPGFSH